MTAKTLIIRVLGFFRRWDHRLFLENLARKRGPVYFVQIGAHDGKSKDSLHPYIIRHRWRGLLVEPVPALFRKLVENYEGAEGLAFENIAIGPSRGKRRFFAMEEGHSELVPWYDFLGSFKREVILKHRQWIPDIENYIQEIQVDCLTFEDLARTHGLYSKRIDLIQIDTEGSDFEILSSIDFKAIRPEYLVYERAHLSPGDAKEARKLLRQAGYEVWELDDLNDLAARRRLLRRSPLPMTRD